LTFTTAGFAYRYCTIRVGPPIWQLTSFRNFAGACHVVQQFTQNSQKVAARSITDHPPPFPSSEPKEQQNTPMHRLTTAIYDQQSHVLAIHGHADTEQT
jgi:hypothetical protein